MIANSQQHIQLRELTLSFLEREAGQCTAWIPLLHLNPEGLPAGGVGLFPRVNLLQERQ